MNVEVFDTADQSAAHGAARIVTLVREDPTLRLGVATGSSPQPLYRALAGHRARGVDFGRISAFALDEYVGLDRQHPESYHSVLDRDFTRPLGVERTRVHVPAGDAPDPGEAAADYELLLAEIGGVHLQILGLGANGHIGFNEPGSSRESRTRVVELTPRTRADNQRFFPQGTVPLRAISQGVATIMSARELLVIASGEAKASAVAAALRGPVGPASPGSFLREHPNVTLLLDRAAASLIDSRGVLV